MAVINTIMRPEGVNDFADEYHPKTNSGQVVKYTGDV